MSMETSLVAILKTVCAKTYPDVAEDGTTPDYVVWQAIGGTTLYFGDNTAADKRNTLIQIDVWSLTRSGATTMIRAIEDALCESPAFTASPIGEASSDYDPDVKWYGSMQRFDVWASR